MGRPPNGKRAMTVAERSRLYRARHPRAHHPPPAAPQPPDLAATAAELIERLKAHPHEAARWLRSKLGEGAANTLGEALTPHTGLTLDQLFLAPNQVLDNGYRRDRFDVAPLVAVRDAISRLLAHPPQRDWDPFRDDPP